VADPSETTRIHRREAPELGTGAESEELVSAVRELSARVGSLQAEVQSLRAQSHLLPAGGERAGWEDARAAGPDNLLWMRALDSPTARAPAVPRLLLEIVFLVAVAVAAAIAELELAEIAAVMGGAWALVALAEWTAARAERRRMEAVYGPLPGVSGYPSDPTWFAPPAAPPPVEEASNGEGGPPKLPPPEPS
jgi:uncharacterized small protein (DUF1192 family)